jgi:hypothetical protein
VDEKWLDYVLGGISMLETLVIAAINATNTLPTSATAVATIGGLASGGLIPFGGSALVGREALS